MTKTNLKNNIWIEGFNDNFGLKYNSEKSTRIKECLYYGKTSEISEELASQCCNYINQFDGATFYKDYSVFHNVYNFKIAKESIQSVCDKEYCIIYKV